MSISYGNFDLIYNEKINLLKSQNFVKLNDFSIEQLNLLIKMDLEKDPDFTLSKYIIENYEVKNDNSNIDILFYSIIFKYYNFVNFLLSTKNRKIDLTDSNKKNVFHYLSADSNFNEIFKKISQGNIDIYSEDKNGVKPIEIALKNKNMELFKLLIKTPQNSTEREIERLFLISANQNDLCHLEEFISLIQQEKNINLYHYINATNEDGENALFISLNNKNYEIAHYLIKNGIQISKDGFNGGIFENFIYDLKSLNLLFNSGLNANQKNIHGDHPIVFLIKSKKVSLENKKTIIDFILKKQLNINFKNRNENSFLNYCSLFRDENTAEFLNFFMDRGAFNYQNIENVNSDDIIGNEKITEQYLDEFNKLYDKGIEEDLFFDLKFKQ